MNRTDGPGAAPVPGAPLSGWTTAPLRLALAIIMLFGAAVSTWRTVKEIELRRSLGSDLAELSNVRYGLLSADSWVEKIVPLLSAKIDVFDLKEVNQESLRRSIESILDKLIDDVRETIRSSNLGRQGIIDGAVGRIRQTILDRLVSFENLHRQVPEYANDVIAGLGTQGTRDMLRQYLSNVLAKSAKDTAGAVDLTEFNAVLTRNGCTRGAACQEMLRTRLREADATIRYCYVTALVSSAIAFVLIWAGGLTDTKTGTMILVAVCAILLMGGLSTPMIEIEAKISRLTFRLLGEPVSFTDQVLYFQTKSIREVVTLLVSAGDFWKSLVGGLVFLFSVVFPAAKLVATTIRCYSSRKKRDTCLVRFFVLKSSKWSMADVMVIAIFMAYIGLDSVVTSSLDGLRKAGGGLTVLTTNGTSLQPGYFLFIGFCVVSLFLSSALDRRSSLHRHLGRQHVVDR